MLSKFFHHCDVLKHDFITPRTFVLVPEAKSDGSIVIVTKCIELQSNPFSALSFDDFSIQKCLQNGVTYGSLGITKDMRVGFESQFEALEQRFIENESKFFVTSSKTE